MSVSARAFLVAIVSLNLTAAAFAADVDGVRLSTLAAASGYSYDWLASEGGVSLQRPGVVIVLHAGYPLYEINAAPQQADRAPRFDKGDLYISRALAQRLRSIAIAHPLHMQEPLSEHQPLSTTSDDLSAPMSTGQLTIHARQIPGHEAIRLTGTAPAGTAVTITLTSELSQDLPTVVLSRTTVMSADDGRYSLVASIDQNAHRGTTISATATSLGGLTSAVAHIIVDAPNSSLDSTLDQFPPK